MRPFTVERQAVTDSEVAEVVAMRETYEALKRRLDLLAPHLQSKEDAIISKLESGADTSRCRYDLEVRVQHKAFPKWRDAYIDKMGEAAANVVYLSTPKKTYKTLFIR